MSSFSEEMRRVATDPDLSVSDAATALVRSVILRLSVDPKAATPGEIAKMLDSLADLTRAQNEAGGDRNVLAELLRGGRDAQQARAARAQAHRKEQHADAAVPVQAGKAAGADRS